MKVKNILIWMLFIAYLSPFISLLPIDIISSITDDLDYARITDVEYTAVVMDEMYGSGKIRVTERLTFDIHALSSDNLFWELWRDLPETYFDDVKVDYNVLSVKEILADGSEVYYYESSKLYWDDSDFTDYPYGPRKMVS